MHDVVVKMVKAAIGLMDGFLRSRMSLEEYAAALRHLDADGVLEKYQEEFKRDPKLIYYLDALMLLSSLQHELDFQIAEYGASVASEDITMLRELLHKFGHVPHGEAELVSIKES